MAHFVAGMLDEVVQGEGYFAGLFRNMKPNLPEHEIYNKIPLGPGSRAIRLMYLMPGYDEMQIRCQLIQADLDEHPDFEALSYCWGDPEKTDMIEVNNIQFSVSSNLYCFLAENRTHLSMRLMWIDAVCINQASQDEKQRQVSIMRDIYASASFTTAYLGYDLPGHKYIKQLIKQDCWAERMIVMAKDAAAERTAYGVVDVARKFQEYRREVRETGKFHAGYDEMLALHYALDSPYFSRSWILQELALSPRVNLQYAQENTRLDNFVKSFKICTSFAQAINDYGMAYGTGHAWFARGRALTLLFDFDFKTASLPLVHGLSRFRSFNASYNLDKLYCLFSLALDDVARLDLVPDYSKTARDLYIETAYAMLTKVDGAAVLEVPRGTSEELRKQLPSWVPDWTDTSAAGSGLTVEAQSLRKPIGLQPPTEDWDVLFPFPDFTSRFKAAGGSRVNVGRMDPDKAIHVSVMVFDKVQDVSQELCVKFDGWLVGLRWNVLKVKSILSDAMQPWSEALRSLDEIVTWRGRGTVYGSGSDDAFFKTICADSLPTYLRFLNTVDEFREMYEKVTAALEKASKWYKIGRKTMFVGSEALKHAAGVGARINAAFNKLSPEMFETYMKVVDCISPVHQRRLAITGQGYLCLVPAGTERDDRLVIAQGGALPLVLRRTGEAYTLIGEAYVHGIMNGEAWDEKHCEWIAIR